MPRDFRPSTNLAKDLLLSRVFLIGRHLAFHSTPNCLPTFHQHENTRMDLKFAKPALECM